MKKLYVLNKFNNKKFIFVFVCAFLLFFVFFSISNKTISCSYAADDVVREIVYPKLKDHNKEYFNVKEGVEYIFEFEDTASAPIINFYFEPLDNRFDFFSIGSNSELKEINSYIDENENNGSKLRKEENGKWMFSLVFHVNGMFYADILFEDSTKKQIIADIRKIDTDAPTIKNIGDIDFDVGPLNSRGYKVPFSDEPKSTFGGKSGIKQVDVIKDKKSESSENDKNLDKNLYVLLTDLNKFGTYNDYLKKIEEYDEKFYGIDRITINGKKEGEYYNFDVIENARYYLRVEDMAGNVNYYFFLNYNKEKDFRYNVDMYVGTTIKSVNIKPLFDNYFELLESHKENTKLETYKYFLDAYNEEVKIFELNFGNEAKLASRERLLAKKEEIENLYNQPKVDYYINGTMQTNDINAYIMDMRFEIQNFDPIKKIKDFKYGEKIEVFITLTPTNIKNKRNVNQNRFYDVLIDIKKDDKDCELTSDIIYVKFDFSPNISNITLNNEMLKNNRIFLMDINESLEIRFYDHQYAKKSNLTLYLIFASIFLMILLFYMFLIRKKSQNIYFIYYLSINDLTKPNEANKKTTK